MKIIPLSEGSFTVDATKKFVPFNTDTDHMEERPKGSLLVEVQPFAVITNYDVLLLDTGLGFTGEDGRLQLHQNLLAAGIGAGDVTKVLMSHLHKDHSGGMLNADGATAAFPNATYFVQRRELENALSANSASYHAEQLRAFAALPQVTWLHDDSGIIDGYINYQFTGAHSVCHQVFWIRENGETIFFGADDAPQLQQMKYRYAAKYDFDGKKAMNLRTDWWQKGAAGNWSFLFYHDIKTPVFIPEHS